MEDPVPLGYPHLFSASPNPLSDPSTPERPHTPMTACRCGTPDSVWQSCPKVYIRQTGRALDHRLKEHWRAFASGNIMQSAVADHATKGMHDIDWEKVEVVDGHPHYRQRCALEAWHIRTEPHTMNRDEGLLPTVYNPLIQQLHRPG